MKVEKKIEQFKAWTKGFLSLGFLLYAVMLIYTTLFIYNYYPYGKSVNLVLFDSIRLMWRSGNYWLIFKNVIGNVLLFMPLGLLLPIILKKVRSLWKIIILGFGTSLLIEILQYEYAHRIFDIDDILLNGFGAIVGYILFGISYGIIRVIKNIIVKRKRK
ncbi:VanZ family protein [Pseudalkalibacillus caeni]|uniref:VanZ family protein n=1 Tax=Exobacillus caeni TaxID=2574798 RepID=A0A5R9F5H5_9BACL|nr:VanZ family protein [Pseudalkalibacillus caeni]TLS35734.1 VanZ family protein [Pseudalkalibacillus caeni]